MHLHGRPPIPTAIIAKPQEWLVLTASPAVPHTLPAHLRSRRQSSPAVLTNGGTDWLVLTADPILPPKATTPFAFERAKQLPPGGAAVALEDKVLEPFVLHRQRSFSSLVTILLEGDKGKNMAAVFSCGT